MTVLPAVPCYCSCVPPSASGEEEEEDEGDRSGPVAHVIFFNNQESL